MEVVGSSSFTALKYNSRVLYIALYGVPYTEFYCSPTDGLDAYPTQCQSGGRGLNTRRLLYVHREA
jgi:hypothetical protein